MEALARTFDSYNERQLEMIERHEETEKQGECVEDRRLYVQGVSASEIAKKLIALKMNPSDMDSEKAHILKVSAGIDRAQANIDKVKAETDELINGVEQGYQNLIQQESKLEPSEYDSEVRQVVRGLTLKDRNELMSEAIKGNDLTVLSAVLLAPPILTGMDKQQHSAFLETHESRKAQQHINRRNNYRKLAGEVNSTFKLVSRVIDEAAR